MGTGTEEAGLRLRDIRRKDWYWVEAVFVEVFLPVLGPLGGAVYNTLCSHVRQDQVRMSLREIGESSGVSKDTVARMMWKMTVLGMVGITTGGKGRYKYTCYVLYDLKDAAAGGIPALKLKLAAAERERTGAVKVRTTVRVEENGSGMLLFDETDEAAKEQPEAQQQESEVQPEAPFVADGDGAEAKEGRDVMSLGETKRMLPNDKLSQNETPFNTKKERQRKNNHPNPSASGRALGGERPEPSGSEPASPAASAPLAKNPSRDVAEPSFGEVLDRLAHLRPRLGDVEDLRGQIESHMATAGFAVARKVRTADRGDGAAGFVELVCTRRLGEPEMETVAFELGAAVARERDLMKLRKLGPAGAVHRVIVLRTATRPVSYEGIHTVLAMGWPGNGQAERLEAAKATLDAALARMRVGQGSEVQLRDGETSQRQPAGAGERATPSGTSVAALLRDVRAEIEGFGAEAQAEWDGAFELASYERHEAVEGAAGGTLLVLASPDPAETVRGLGQYSARIERAMAARFGPRVQVQVVAWDGSVSAGEESL